MTSQKPLYRKKNAFDCAELPHRFDSVFAAARHKPALSAQNRAQNSLVESYDENKALGNQKSEYFSFCPAFFQSRTFS
jgi:hypothetical protein